ncbi:hypothetical protein H072_8027 [Dactylellina haptotyla CBS 200.50]|uniref:Uncharacterized protein n=1 Tax=Dactylellina haptotyla (strain CBS 200.50) TaxID=1284197 RepID=S8BGF8_DACHA|nr:hypothetical protein H072_8027 [Dactylellina haptotyla CBS 200.50]
MATKLKISDYRVGWICAISIELAAVCSILDETHPQLDVADGDTNVYTFGRIGRHNVVIACLPEGRYGITRASIVATHMRSTFTNLRFGLMVGVGGGAPSEENDIRLGDIVISQPTGVSGGVVQYDFGKAMENGKFLRIGFLNAPPAILLSAVTSMKAKDPVELGEKLSDTAQKIEEKDLRFLYPGQDTDKLFNADYNHISSEGRHRESCKACDSSKWVPRSERQHDHPYIHYGIVASGNQVMKDGIKRDRISAQTGALCFEMEAAGLMDDFPCLVIRGICDYSDGHKNKRWQPYAALVAAIYAKELLLRIPITSTNETEVSEQGVIEKINVAIPFHMPFPRNPTFFGRAEELRQIYKHFSDQRSTDSPRIYVLTGTGGMGKTQIALEYSFRHHKDYTAVFWVSAASEDTIRASFLDVMQCIVEEQARITWPESAPNYEAVGFKLGIPGLVDSKGIVSANLETIDNIRSALFRWLRLPGNDKWLLIFDNADDLETFDIQDYLPSQGGGAIMITSRRPEFSHNAREANLEGLDQESAVKLILSLAPLLDNSGVARNEVTALVQKLGFMPLAISHAGCYMHQTRASPGDYMSEYEKAFVSVQIKPRTGWNYRDDTAATTWEISFSHIEKKDKEAASLLLTCSYLNPAEILETLWEDGQSDKAEVKDRVLLLASYSLVKITRFGIFSIHPVVHSWARGRLDDPERYQALEHAVVIIGKAIRRPNISRESGEWEAQEERRIGSHLGYLDRYSKRSLSEFLRQQERSSEYPTLLDHIHNIALVFNKQGKYDEAMRWYERALAGKEKALGKEHPSILSTVHNIAIVFGSQGKYDEAMQWYERALAGSEKALGKDHPSTLSTVECLHTLTNKINLSK